MPRRLPSLDAIVASVLRHPRRQVGAAVRRHHAELEVRGRRAFTASRGRLGEDSAATMAGGFDGAAIYGPALASPPRVFYIFTTIRKVTRWFSTLKRAPTDLALL